MVLCPLPRWSWCSCSTSTCLTLPRHLVHLLPRLRSEESSRLVGIFRDETLIHSGRILEASAPSPRGPLSITRPPAVQLTSRLSVIPSPLAQRAFPAQLKWRMSEEFKELSSGCFPLRALLGCETHQTTMKLQLLLRPLFFWVFPCSWVEPQCVSESTSCSLLSHQMWWSVNLFFCFFISGRATMQEKKKKANVSDFLLTTNWKQYVIFNLHSIVNY